MVDFADHHRSVRSVRTWLKEWGARKSDQSNTAPFRDAFRNTSDRTHPSQMPSAAQTLRHEPVHAPVPEHESRESISFSELGPGSPTSSRTSRRPTGLRIRTTGLDDTSMKSVSLTQSTSHSQGLQEYTIMDGFDQMPDLPDGEQSASYLDSIQPENETYGSATMDSAQITGVQSHCPSLLSPHSGYASSSTYTSAPNSYSILSPSPMDLYNPDDAWARATQSHRQYFNAETATSRFLSPATANDRTGVEMRYAPVQNANIPADSSPYLFGEVPFGPKVFDNTRRYSQPQAPAHLCPMVPACSFHHLATTNAPFQCQFCGASRQVHQNLNAAYSQDNRGHPPGPHPPLSYYPPY